LTSGGLTNVMISASNGGGTGTATLAIAVNQAPAFLNGPPAAGILNSAYSFSYSASGYPAPTYSVTSGALPPGLNLSANGLISGTTTATGIYAGTVTASNGIGTAATQNFSIQIGQAPAFTDGPPPSGTLNNGYSFTYSASGFPAANFTLTSGALPPG